MAQQKRMFNEKDTENINGVNCSVIQTAKYQESKNKAIELIESKKYGLSEADFWILQNRTKNGNYVMYSGLIISHNGCLKINDSLPVELKFNQKYCSEPIYCEYTKGLRMDYRDEQGLYEVGEITPTNCRNEYPFAMLLKRLMDRVILKNSKVAFSGIYSEVEAEEIKNEEFKNEESIKVNAQTESVQNESLPRMTDEQYQYLKDCSEEEKKKIYHWHNGTPWNKLDANSAKSAISFIEAERQNVMLGEGSPRMNDEQYQYLSNLPDEVKAEVSTWWGTPWNELNTYVAKVAIKVLEERKSKPQEQQKEPEEMDNEQFLYIDKLSREWQAWIEKKFMVNKWSDLNKEQADAVIKIVEQRKKGNK